MKLYTIDEVAECISRIEADEAISLRLYTVDEVALILKINKNSLYNYIRTNKIKAAKFGHAYRIQEEDLLEFIQKSKNEGGKEREDIQSKLLSERWGHTTLTPKAIFARQYRGNQ